MEQNNKRDKLADLLKGYACLLVVFGHVIMGIRKASIVIPNGMYQLELFIWTFHVALFMFLSGYVYNINGGWKSKKSRKSFIVNKLVNLGIPYIVFSVIYILINSIISSTNSEYTMLDIIFILRKPVAQYWFIYALFMLFVIWTAMSNFMKNWQITIIITLLGTIAYFGNISLGIIDSAISMALPFGLGTCLNKYYIDKEKYSKKICLMIIHILAVGILIFYNIDNYIISKIEYILGIFASIAFISILQKQKNIENALSWINKISFPIYLLHTIFTAGIRVILIKVGVSNYYIHVLLGMTMGILGPFLFWYVANKNFLFGIILYPSRTVKNIKQKHYELS